MFSRFKKDSFISGMLLGIIPVAIGFYTFINYHELMENAGWLHYKLYPPRIQLIILAVSVIVFRFMMVKWDMTKSGMGFFLVIFLAAIIYFMFYRNKIF